jgi:DnaJ-class molecular chaperone
MKTRKIHINAEAICRNCKGTGQCITRDPREDDVPIDICEICEGSGMVLVHKEIIVTITPLKKVINT